MQSAPFHDGLLAKPKWISEHSTNTDIEKMNPNVCVRFIDNNAYPFDESNFYGTADGHNVFGMMPKQSAAYCCISKINPSQFPRQAISFSLLLPVLVVDWYSLKIRNDYQKSWRNGNNFIKLEK
jgi:hypothetical protein